MYPLFSFQPYQCWNSGAIWFRLKRQFFKVRGLPLQEPRKNQKTIFWPHFTKTPVILKQIPTKWGLFRFTYTNVKLLLGIFQITFIEGINFLYLVKFLFKSLSTFNISSSLATDKNVTHNFINDFKLIHNWYMDPKAGYKKV